ncbi:MAG: hypothetical protein ABJG78_09245 [Cyclobacteriaceae bacterium]
MARSKIDLRSLIIEALLIVFTVLLALTLSEWRSSIKQEDTKKAVLNNIIREIKSNKEDLESKMEYHLEMSKKLNNYVQSDGLWSTLTYSSGIEAMIQIMEKGLLNPTLQSGAWRSAELSGIVNTFDFETILILSAVYQVQHEGPESTWKTMAGHFGNPFSYEPKNAKLLARMLQLGFSELYAQERSLVSSYQNALEALAEAKE